jgi:hypothetical protein
MMFDPTSLGESLKPGDKMSLHFHKGQPKTSAPSFMDNVQAAQGGPGASQGPGGLQAPSGAPMPPAAPPQAGGGFSGMSPAPTSDGSMGMPSSVDPRAMMMAALQRRMGGQ